MKKLQSLREIDIETIEGRTLIAALGTLSCQPGYTDKEPDDILRDVSSRIVED